MGFCQFRQRQCTKQNQTWVAVHWWRMLISTRCAGGACVLDHYLWGGLSLNLKIFPFLGKICLHKSLEVLIDIFILFPPPSSLITFLFKQHLCLATVMWYKLSQTAASSLGHIGSLTTCQPCRDLGRLTELCSGSCFIRAFLLLSDLQQSFQLLSPSMWSKRRAQHWQVYLQNVTAKEQSKHYRN